MHLTMEHQYNELPVAIDCHPTRQLIATGFIDGAVLISSYQFIHSKYSTKGVSKVSQTGPNLKVKLKELHHRQHKRSVRRLKFTPDAGDRLMVITKNRALCQWDVETGRKIRCIRECHDMPPFALHCLTDDQLATGDEIGTVKLWDWRAGTGQAACVATFEQEIHVDIINDLTSSADKRILLAASGDGTMSAINVKNRALETQSEEMHAELLSVAITKNGEKVICGSGEGGYVEIFNWNEFGNIIERMQTGHQDSVDRLVNIDDYGLVASASSTDGCIRLLRIGQNGDLGIIGQHEEDGASSGVEDICCTSNQQYLISCGQDQKLRFWDLDEAKRRLGFKMESDDVDSEPKRKKVKKKKPAKKSADTSFFNGLLENEGAQCDQQSEDESDSDGSDSD